jgi:hypothetical protein
MTKVLYVAQLRAKYIGKEARDARRRVQTLYVVAVPAARELTLVAGPGDVVCEDDVGPGCGGHGHESWCE